jgi:hypothetical protein
MQSSVLNAQSFGAPALIVTKRFLRLSRVNNVSFFADKVVSMAGKLLQERVVNTPSFGEPIVRVSCRYLQNTAFQNTSQFGAHAVTGSETFQTPSYANTGGTGDRTAIITVTTTAALGGGTPSNLVDGAKANNNTDAMWWNAGQTLREIKFDFGAKKLITEAKWYQNGPSSSGTWKWQGSNDNSTYTDLSTGFTMTAGGAGDVIGDLSANTTGYRYYKALQTAGATNDTPWLWEIEFRIGNLI